MTKCCQVFPYQDPIYFDETNCRIGTYDRCPKCERLVGREANIAYTAPAALRGAWNVYSEIATREHYARSSSPLRYVFSKQGLVPVGYKPKVETAEVEEQF